MHVAADPTRERAGRTRVREFGQNNTSGLTQHPEHFAEDLCLVVCVMETDDRNDPVEVLIGKGNRFPAALLESQAGSPFPAFGEFLPVRLQDDDIATPLGEMFGRRPGTSSHIEQTQSGRRRKQSTQNWQVLRSFPHAQALGDPN